MSVEILREAASLMRERAKAATPGPWEGGERIVWSNANTRNPYVVTDGEGGDGGAFSVGNVDHIASWHPAVALAVADLLDISVTHQVGFTPIARERITAIARAYLGESS